MKQDRIQRPVELVQAFFRSPVIIGILAGILLNLAGIGGSLAAWPITGAIMATLIFLAGLTVPLILIIVGYGIKLDRSGLGRAVRVPFIRLLLLLPLAFLLSRLLIRDLLQLEKAYEIALFTLLILPPPFIIPLFMRRDMPAEARFVNNVLTLYTLVTIVVFIIYFIFNPTLA
jgi:hypothetical protein